MPASTQQEVHFVFCSLMLVNAIDDHLNISDRNFLKSIDFSGKEVFPENNKPFINIYDDGSVERQLTIE